MQRLWFRFILVLALPVVALRADPVVIRVDAALDRHPIDPRIYGVAFASSNTLAALGSPLNRSGGNAETRYHWQLNAHNHASDWYFESLADASAVPGAEADAFVAGTRGAGAEAMLTIPMIGWAPTLGPGRQRRASYSIAKYGPQTGNDWEWFADAGNGIRAANGQPIVTNDPHDANMPVDAGFQSNWVQHLVGTWGASTAGGVRYYCLDNEHGLWHETHRDVHPVGATMEEVRDRMATYAGMIKDVDPAALTLGPEEWGWTGYLYSGFDQQAGRSNGWSYFPDRVAHGGADYMPWMLGQLRQRSEAAGRRLLDVFTLHCYPQGGEFGNDVSVAMQQRRNRSTRALWDTNYVDETWIDAVVQLIPRMRQWVATQYPGTAIGITEYNWGAEGHINGATAQADLLGIFGREGLDLATRWVAPSASSPVGLAMRLYRDVDGAGRGFGEMSVRAERPNPDVLAVFAAERAVDESLTVMAVHKALQGAMPATVEITNATVTGPAMAWQLTASNVILRLPDLAVASNRFEAVLPAQSITLFVIPRVIRPRLSALASDDAGVGVRLEGAAGQQYVIETSTNLAAWQPVQTNALTTNSLWVALGTNGVRAFYRAAWRP
jgi:hypothetical protein